ncbi:MAG: glutamine synthetase [Oceanospirillaceae bacterium]|jgi:glutamine synthetase|nr:glutamine synthetase [Oceanospirillaceae bacterium]MBT4443333.1 glutamine synthetase [Oceanospirillaceae bacterium]MBT6077378.1 glutamine synthetase [Oceanospirillaceae bacterium]MBT7330466.1 glutamine synthetase [Oceanospirillaceae bacterium]
MPHTIALSSEAEAFLAVHPDLVSVDLLLPDQHGVLRGKRVPAHELVKVYQHGIFLPGSVFALDINGNTVESTGIGFDTGDCDQPCRPIASSLTIVPWQDKPMAQCLLTMEQEPGTPYFANPRHVLDRTCDQFEALGYTPMVAVELEFYLTDTERLNSGQLQPPISPLTGLREADTQVYAVDNIDDYSALLDDIINAAQLQNIPASTAVAEYAPGQFEVNLQHVANPVLACDQALLLKRIIKSVSRKHGFSATFMAKPYADQAGSGMHIHMSLLDSQGHNVFASQQCQPNALLTQTLAGLQHTMGDTMALLCPKVNSYRRFQPDFFVAMAPTWGIDNRTVALRIPNGPATARRIEHRVAGADANPYLAMAALLAGTLHGLSNDLPLSVQTTGNGALQQAPSLPLNWVDAYAKFEHSEFAQTYFGGDFMKVYGAVQRQEYVDFNSQVSRLEIDWYQRTL